MKNIKNPSIKYEDMYKPRQGGYGNGGCEVKNGSRDIGPRPIYLIIYMFFSRRAGLHRRDITPVVIKSMEFFVIRCQRRLYGKVMGARNKFIKVNSRHAMLPLLIQIVRNINNRALNQARREIQPLLPGSDIVPHPLLIGKYNKKSRQMRLAEKFGQTNLLARRRKFFSSPPYPCTRSASMLSPHNVASK